MSPKLRSTTQPERGAGEMTHFDIAIIGTGSGNSIIDERYVRQTGRDLRTRGVRRHLPQCRLHTHEDVRLRGRSRPKCQGISAIRRGRAYRRCPVAGCRVARVRPNRPDRDGRRELPTLVAECPGVLQPHPVRADEIRWQICAAHRRRRGVHRRPGGHRRRARGPWCPTPSPHAGCRITPATPSCASPTCRSA